MAGDGTPEMRSGVVRAHTLGWAALVGLCIQGVAGDAVAQPSGERTNRANSANVTQEQGTVPDAPGANDSERVDDSFQPKGVELGSFLLFPRLEIDALWSSNVFASEADPRSDIITRIAPELRARSRFTRHELNFRGELEQYVFRTFDDDNRIDASASADGKLDIQRGWEATGLLSFVNRGEDRGSPNVEQGLAPSETYTGTALFGTRRQLGRFVLQGDVGVDRRIFEDTRTSTGRNINNTDRNRWEYRARGRAFYEFRPNYSVVIDSSVNKREYDDAVDDSGFDRSSDGYRIEGGIAVDISQLIRGDFVAGYLRQDYEDPRLTDPSGYALRASFNWTPTRLTVVIPSLERTVQETVSATASAIIKTGGGVVVRHEFARNMVATLTTNISFDDYAGSTEEAWNYEARLRGIYAFSREWYSGVELGYRGRESNRTGSSYDQVTILLRVGARL